MKPILFDFDDYQLTDASRSALSETADCLRDFPARIVIEGHCDERGTQEYNLALGEKRASMVRSYLRTMGLDPTLLVTRSKGENEPVCNRATGSCYALNRRVEFLRK